MLHYELVFDPDTQQELIKTSYLGKALLTTPLLNKGTAFTDSERRELQLLGKLPSRIETLEEQVLRVYHQYQSYHDDLQKNIFLSYLHDDNEILFYKLVSLHLNEMLPMIYTPIVGRAVKQYSQEFRKPRGIYLSYPDRASMKEMLANRTHPHVQIIVATDGERVLGIGDQGVGAMDISVAKLMVYTLCGRVNPYHTLPIILDVGTDNEELLADPMYLGWRHPRIRGQEYDDFIQQFIDNVKAELPYVFLHWEDFGRDNARRILERYREEISSFNDDMQGTAVVTLAAILAGVHRTGVPLTEHRIVVFGAGTAGVGIVDQICLAYTRLGLSPAQARAHFWLVDRFGLILDGAAENLPMQMPYARPPAEWAEHPGPMISLEQVVKTVKPTILIGCAAIQGAFTEALIKDMAAHCKQPIILPLSNPNERAEACPHDLIHWTEGRALVATGSPYEPVSYNEQLIPIAQSNNALVFPGIGMGVLASRAARVTDAMLMAACDTLAGIAGEKDSQGPLLPGPNDAQMIAQKIALSVAQQAVAEGVHRVENIDLSAAIEKLAWAPYYRPYKIASSEAKC